MATIEAVCAQVQEYMLTLSGVRAAPAIPKDLAPEGIFTLCYPGGGTWKQEPAGVKKGVHRVLVEVYTARKDTPRDLARLYPYYETIPNLLFKNLFVDYWGGLVQSVGTIEVTKPQAVTFNDVPHWVVQFTVNDVKMLSTIA